MKHCRTIALYVVLLCWLLLYGCAGAELSEEAPGNLIDEDETWEKNKGSTAALRDSAARYEGENEPPVITFYLTVGRGNAAEGTDHTWAEVNDFPMEYYEQKGIAPYQCEAVLQVGDEAGPLPDGFGYGQRAANATVRLRGSGASRQPQKSYRIAIKQGKGRFEDQKVVVLNKHSSDPLRFKNRLAYGLMQQIPGLFSARTRFVHLYVKDKTEGENGLFEDYGLYTQVEQPNKAYLKAHGLDKDGQLYQADRFDWGRHPDALRLATDPGFSRQEFEQYLEIKGSDDHSKLLSLLDAVNDRAKPIVQVVDTYFDRDNLYSWLAFQILTGNRDAAYGGYYLYSPQLLDKWYLISWDNDGMLSDSYQKLRDPAWTSSWNHGIFSFTGSVLFRRMLQDESCRAALDEKVEMLFQESLSSQVLSGLARNYAGLAKPYVYKLPDRIYGRVNMEDYDDLVLQLPAEVEMHYQEYRDSLLEPWPFHILAPEPAEGGVLLRWEDAYLHETRETVSYTVELAKSYAFDDCILKKTDAADTQMLSGPLLPGQYFLRVRASVPSGASQDACEVYYAESGAAVCSTICFYVMEDGSIELSEFDTEE